MELTLIRLHCFGFAFTPKRAPTVFLLLVLPLLIGLGVWQLHRAGEKHQLQTQFHARQASTLSLKDIHTHALKSLRYRRIRITGHYDNAHSLLVDNKIREHRVGYFVITPFIPTSGDKMVLVNRGWVASTGSRTRLPTIQQRMGRQTIEGLIKITPQKSFLLNQDSRSKTWPALVQAISMRQLKKIYRKPFYPFIVLLSPTSPGTFPREWHPVVITPAKHVAYAVQWFSLALTFVIIYFILTTQRGKDDKSGKKPF